MLGDPLIELVTVNGEISLSVSFPDILLVDRYTEKMGKYLGNTTVMIAYHPHYLDSLPRVGGLPDEREELPIITREAFKVQIIEYVAVKNEALKAQHPEELYESFRPGDIRTQMNIRDDNGIEIRLVIKMNRL